MSTASSSSTNQKVVVFDFGAQYGQLIARRVRDLNVYSEIVPCDITADEVREMAPAAIILSGGPASVNAEDAPRVDPAIYELGVPILGFCYGHQVTSVTLGGSVYHPEVGEYGPATLHVTGGQLFAGTPADQTVWMSHFDAVKDVPAGFTVVASTDVCPVAAMECPERKIYTTQFHPEVKHTEFGNQMLKNFLFDICGLEPNWTMDNLVETLTADFREKVGSDRVILALSGGVDSSVVAALGARKTGGKAATIKSHHNLIPFPEGVHFDLIEPLDHFFKDEVRALGTALGLPDHIVHRQPFPGPGLAIRIIGAVSPEKLEILKNADAIVREELDAYNQRLFEETGERNSEHSCWQYFAVLPDIKSVGVMGDERTYQRPIILRAVESSDAMTADWAKLPYELLAKISSRIVAEVPGANRVCYDITPKPPATIEWE